MLLVKTKIAPSGIAGTGLFADEFIPKGTCVWKYEKGFDIRVDKDYPESLPETARDFFMTYAYQDPQTLDYTLCADDGRFFNHSDTPNTHSAKDSRGEYEADIASKDIQVGEELTTDYREFDTNPFYGFEK
jgi:SET domain-containing protein